MSFFASALRLARNLNAKTVPNKILDVFLCYDTVLFLDLLPSLFTSEKLSLPRTISRTTSRLCFGFLFAVLAAMHRGCMGFFASALRTGPSALNQEHWPRHTDSGTLVQAQWLRHLARNPNLKTVPNKISDVCRA
jgi:hypothetical protein